MHENPSSETLPPAIPILLDDQHFMIVNKPAGLFSQAAAGIASVETQLAQQLKLRDAHPGTPFIGLPHRLDRSTSGAMLVARNQRSLARFGAQFQSRKVGKLYLAILVGSVADDFATWSDRIRKLEGEPRAEIVPPEAEGGRQASLAMRVLARSAKHSLVLVQLHTGRMHQIRVQAASRGLPVLGDPTYGEILAGSQTEYSSAIPIGLHAMRLEIRHPKTAKQISCTADLPEAWQDYVPELVSKQREIVRRSAGDTTTAWDISSQGDGTFEL